MFVSIIKHNYRVRSLEEACHSDYWTTPLLIMTTDEETKQFSLQDVSDGQTELVRDNLPEILQRYSDAELKVMERKLLRKVDLRLLPTMILIYIMNYLDR
jgi:hypothetical protein